jgi:hypothetical protein
VIVRVVDIGGIDDHHSLNFLFIFTIISGGNNLLHVKTPTYDVGNPGSDLG